MNVTITPTKRQSTAWKYLTDNTTNVVLFGGAASGGKSWLGSLWVITMCLQYAGVRYLVGRTVLQQLKLTTLNTIFELFNKMGLKSGEHYTYNGQTNVITFYNKSEIILKDLAYNPSDPQFDSLGSLEVSGAFVDESSQITHLSFSVIKSRIRYKLNEYGLIPKVLLTCNPANNWIKREFYTPYVQDTLPDNIKFVPSLVTDNPHVPQSYIEMLKELPSQQRQRLLEGKWDYEQDSDAIFDFDSITSCIYKFSPNETDKKYMSVDVSRFGDDRSVIMIWVGLVLIECHVYRKVSTTELSTEIRSLMTSHKIPNSQVIIDSDGIGAGVADQIRSVNFVNNASPFHNQNFTNLKSQCYLKLSELFKEGKISINLSDPAIIDDLTQELLAIKLKNLDKDTKIGVQSKDEMKRVLGKSPDLADAVCIGMYPHVKTLKTTGRYSLAFV